MKNHKFVPQSDITVQELALFLASCCRLELIGDLEKVCPPELRRHFPDDFQQSGKPPQEQSTESRNGKSNHISSLLRLLADRLQN